MKRTCKQCGKEFELGKSEIAFYKGKHLDLPRRCKECRDKNKQKKKQRTDEHTHRAEQKGFERKAPNTAQMKSERKASDAAQMKSERKTPVAVQPERMAKAPENIKMERGKQTGIYKIAAAVIALIAVLCGVFAWNVSQKEEPADPPAAVVQDLAEQSAVSGLSFRNETLLNEHYEKHGIEMGFASAGEYEAAAIKVVENTASLHKLETEDGDDVYYLEDTNEFVIVSTDGYIRTYFCPNDGIEYYNRQ